ncbi:3-keto-disaccharide hydrolase [Zavarzinella formosa]|uniref:3-keto-disaccharide hydrolase n=1 Tax=Zavarzinella formosa TaxID=360055 RepID=UPI0002E606AB|nr:DUF1080 domain-containing protein [Zavarzinella formosa]
MQTRLAAIITLLFIGSISRADEKDGWMELFNGKDFTGWVIDGPKDYKDKADGNKVKPLWTVEEGLIRTTGNGFGFLRYDKKFDNFVFHVEYRMVKEKDVNSGLGIRTMIFDPKKSLETRPSMYSYEVQLLDDTGAKPNEHGTGSLYRYVAPAKTAHKPAPEWNTVEVECVGPKIRISFNGTETLNFDQSTNPKLKDKPLSGYVCLQTHSKQVEFKNVRLKVLK